ncbi:dihydropteroate synthase [Euzebya tangerina]|uniref:dihydropteroate synthase n=1 Tax=Euzebya tangerina TaxID=591198 RepID=UPI000E31F554|nr:dihydropteroate synthase [Euzebya tangerina]
MSLRNRTFDFDREVAVMAIVNRTPDSFYDQGATFALESAVAHALDHVADGADILDVGGVKAGPGEEVTAQEELDRIIPFVERFRDRSDAVLSIDTFRPSVADAALRAGADIINDTSGLADPDLAPTVARFRDAGLVLMHSGGQIRTRPYRNHYVPDATTAIVADLSGLVEQAVAAGVDASKLIVDPGHDFRKNTLHSLEITRRLGELSALGHPVLVALSNKDFIGESLDLDLPDRVDASIGAAVTSVMLGARLVRVHETLATKRAVMMAEVIMGWREPARAWRGMA